MQKPATNSILRRVFLQRTLAFGVASIPTLTAIGQSEERAAVAQYSDPATYEVEHRVTFNNGTSDLSSLELWLPLPLPHPEQQVLALSPPNGVPQYRDLTGTANVARLYATRGLPGRNGVQEMVATYQVTSRARSTDHQLARAEQFEDYRANEAYRQFTRSEELIQVGNGDIAQQAATLRAAHSTPYAFARAAYEWVLDRTQYRLVSGPKGAKFCYENQYGECGEYSMLFVALCRAAGVPARPVVGCWANKRNGWHVWAEFMLPSGAWVPVDGSSGDHASAEVRNANFGSLNNERLIFCKTCDVHLQGVSAGRSKIEFLQVGAWWWYASRLGSRPRCEFTVTGKPI